MGLLGKQRRSPRQQRLQPWVRRLGHGPDYRHAHRDHGLREAQLLGGSGGRAGRTRPRGPEACDRSGEGGIPRRRLPGPRAGFAPAIDGHPPGAHRKTISAGAHGHCRPRDPRGHPHAPPAIRDPCMVAFRVVWRRWSSEASGLIASTALPPVSRKENKAASARWRRGGKGFELPPRTGRLVAPRGSLPEAVLAVDRPRPVGFEGHLRLLAAVGADHVVHLPRPAVEPSATTATASVSIHVSNSFCRPFSGSGGRMRGVQVYEGARRGTGARGYRTSSHFALCFSMSSGIVVYSISSIGRR